MAQQVNSIVIGGNLTRDPELRHTAGGTPVCSLRIANNRRYKDSATGEWSERPGYFDVTVWGNMGENQARYLSKGSAVVVKGELQWREWETREGGKRQSVEIKADEVQWIGGGSRDRDEQFVPAGASSSMSEEFADTTASTDATNDFTPAAGYDDDIPF